MKLSREDAAQFFDLFFPMLEFAGERLHGSTEKLFMPSGGVNKNGAYEIADAMWSNMSIIDDYLNSTPLKPEGRAIVAGWKRAIHGTFVLERHLTSGSIFMDKSFNVYLVKGITDPLQFSFEQLKTPFIINTTLLPYKGVIITDGLFMAGKTLSPQFAEQGRTIYLAARRGGGIQKKL